MKRTIEQRVNRALADSMAEQLKELRQPGTAAVVLTHAEISYLLLLVSTECDMETESQHLPDESGEERALTAHRKLHAAFLESKS